MSTKCFRINLQSSSCGCREAASSSSRGEPGCHRGRAAGSTVPGAACPAARGLCCWIKRPLKKADMDVLNMRWRGFTAELVLEQ